MKTADNCITQCDSNYIISATSVYSLDCYEFLTCADCCRTLLLLGSDVLLTNYNLFMEQMMIESFLATREITTKTLARGLAENIIGVVADNISLL